MLNHVEYGFSSKNLCIRPRQPMGRARDHDGPQYSAEQVRRVHACTARPQQIINASLH